MEKKLTLERLLKVGSFTELFGIFSGFKLDKVVDKIKTWGLVGEEFWARDDIEAIIAPYRKHVKQNHVTEKATDLALQNFAKAIDVDLNMVRRIFYQVGDVKKPEKRSTEIIDEAEDDLPEINEEEATEEETDTE